jgi:hypothetical protein
MDIIRIGGIMKTRIPRDNIHMSWRPLDGYNKWLNFFFSPREPGKTDTTWWEKIYSGWCEDHKPWVYFVRQSVEITDAMIDDIENTLNFWSITPIEFKYNKGNFKDGIVDVKIGDKLFFRIVSLSIALRRLKLAKVPDCGGIFMDEYIINPKLKERYQEDEWFKIKEFYTTQKRTYHGKGFLKIYICANPYSLFNPIFTGLGVDVNALRKDEYIQDGDELVEYNFPLDGISFKDYKYKLVHHIYVGQEYAIEWGVLHPVLKKYLITKNPLYRFDEEYNSYALEGMAINDRNIKLGKLPPNYFLQFVLRVDNKNIGIFRNNYIDELKDTFFCKFVADVSMRRAIYCFDFNEMIERTILVSLDERVALQRFKEAFRKRDVSFENINVYYYLEEVYKNI